MNAKIYKVQRGKLIFFDQSFVPLRLCVKFFATETRDYGLPISDLHAK